MSARAEIEILASDRRLAAGLSSATTRFNTWSSSVARNAQSQFSRVKPPGGFSTMGSAMGNFGGNLLTRGFDAITGVASDALSFERDLVRFGISSRLSAEELDRMRKELHATSEATGVNSNEIIKAARSYFDLTSDAKGATDAMKAFAKVATASETKLEDINRVAAAAADSFGVKPDAFIAMFSGLISQADEGKVALKDMAGEFASLLPKFATFGGARGAAGVLELGAAFQVAAKGFGSASQAATGLEALMGMLKARQKQLGAAGVKVFDVKNGVAQLRNLHDIVRDIGAKLKDERRFHDIFGENKEALDALRQLTKLEGKWRDIEEAGKNATTVERNFAEFTTSDVGRIDLQMNKMRETMVQAFTPERIHAFAGSLESVAKVFETIVGAVDVLEKATGVTDQERFETAQSVITGKGIGPQSHRKMLGDELGVDLESMTPDQRAEALAKISGTQDSYLGTENVRRAGRIHSTVRRKAKAVREANEKADAEDEAAAIGSTFGPIFGPASGAASDAILRQLIEAMKAAKEDNRRALMEVVERLVPELRAIREKAGISIDDATRTRASKS